MNLRLGDIPSSVEYIEISSVRSVTIGRRALYDLHRLRDLTIRDVRLLAVSSDGLALPDGARLQSMDLHRLRSVSLQEDALSGRWPPSAELRIHHVDHMRMKRRALHFEADGRGPQVTLEHVADLHADGGAFRATMRQLSLVNVSMRSCQPGTFRGSVTQLRLLGCELRSVESRCIQPDGPWEEVFINACDIGDVRRGALTGDVGTLRMEASNVTRLHSGAVEMSLQRLALNRMHMRVVEAYALNVSVCRSLAVMESGVDELRRHALAGVRLAECGGQDVRPFTIHLLHVGSAESSSLAVHESVPAGAVNWDSITFATECSCAMRSDLGLLVAGDEAETMSDTQRALTEVVQEKSFCSDADGKPVQLAEATAGCPGSDRPGDEVANGGGDTSLDQNIVFYGVVAGVSVLVLALVAVLVWKRRRVGRALGCAGAGGGGGEMSVCDTLQSHRTAGTVANSTLSSVGGGSTLGAKSRYWRGLPDLLTAAPGVDLSPPHPRSYPGSLHAPPRAEAPHDHIYAEIGPLPAVSDYADPRDSLALQQESETAPERGQYAEIAPLVGNAEPEEAAPPPPPNPPPVENGLYARTDELQCPVTHL